MRMTELRVIQARIPLRHRVRHASHSRNENDTILVRCQLDDGSVGWGEGLPREYVTGETIDTAWQHLTSLSLRSLSARFDSSDGLAETVRSIHLPRPADHRDCFGNAARCALELAILDAGCRALGIPLAQFIRQIAAPMGMHREADTVHYSAVLTSTSLLKLRLRCWLYRYYNFRQYKVKVGVSGESDQKRLQIVRRIVGPGVSIRIDANEAWSPNVAVRRLQEFGGLGIESVEQPVRHTDIDALREIRSQTAIPIMLDESLCSLHDAEYAIDHELCDSFNLRLSKCGGILPSLVLAQQAKSSGLTCQLGCQVGETGLLSAAGRQFATAVAGLTAVEGSYDRFLVKEPLTVEDLTFGRAGEGEVLAGSGLGVVVDPQALQRVQVREFVHRLPK